MGKRETGLAKQWDGVYDGFRGGRLSVWRENASPFFSAKTEYLKRLGLKSVLDAGCGDGRNLMEFARAGFEVTGVDMSQSALDKCRQNCKGLDVKLEKQNLEKMAFPDNSFDIIICDFVTAHMENPQAIMGEFHRLLKKGGLLLAEFTSTKDPHCGEGEKIGENEFLQKGFYLRFYTMPQVEKLLEKFEILMVDSASYTDPDHGSGYNRKERHSHHSYFITAKK
ncbi:MAG: class I SAM-dependent methyltransferase [Candidatus Diapherotrites archaeon]|uniref:Class I SAM-dependent methyltransferase n=1 Tax=Candidatus Iainarchaeum sp. TaxID=3101447 RepID=A0A8T3YMI4_9ARCH|nr:class I SAM-dependent methyltransferase [Candidatus Diapherotrites archaeon]